MHPERFAAIQHGVIEEGVDAWVFYDFRGSDPIGRRVLGCEEGLATRRWFYCIPARGEAVALVSAVEPRVLDGLPGRTVQYRTWQELHAVLAAMLAPFRRVAMQYSPGCTRVRGAVAMLTESCAR